MTKNSKTNIKKFVISYNIIKNTDKYIIIIDFIYTIQK